MQIKIASFLTLVFGICVIAIIIRDLPKFSTTLPVPQKDVKGLEDQEIRLSLTVTIAQTEYSQVVRVIDGDTIVVFIHNKNETIRLIGIDTPESDPRQGVECFGKEASKKLKELLTNKTVRLEEDTTQSNRDRYQRLLRYIFLPDGTAVNLIMIKEGYAHEYTYQTPYKYRQEFRQAEVEAREKKRGLWGDVCLKN